MRDLLKAIVVTLIVVSIYGFFAGDRMRLTYIETSKPKRFSLIVSAPDVDARYAVLIVQACAAEVSENGAVCLEGGWSTDSRRSMSAHQRQYEVPFPPPRGTIYYLAAAVDRDAQVLASSRLILMRGYE